MELDKDKDVFSAPDTIFRFSMGLYARHIDFLRKYDFEEEVDINTIPVEDHHLISDLIYRGMLYKDHVNGKTYIQGTIIYSQYKR